MSRKGWPLPTPGGFSPQYFGTRWVRSLSAMTTRTLHCRAEEQLSARGLNVSWLLVRVTVKLSSGSAAASPHRVMNGREWEVTLRLSVRVAGVSSSKSVPAVAQSLPPVAVPSVKDAVTVTLVEVTAGPEMVMLKLADSSGTVTEVGALRPCDDSSSRMVTTVSQLVLDWQLSAVSSNTGFSAVQVRVTVSVLSMAELSHNVIPGISWLELPAARVLVAETGA